MDEYYEVMDSSFIKEYLDDVWGEDWDTYSQSSSDVIDAFRLGMKFADVAKSG